MSIGTAKNVKTQARCRFTSVALDFSDSMTEVTCHFPSYYANIKKKHSRARTNWMFFFSPRVLTKLVCKCT